MRLRGLHTIVARQRSGRSSAAPIVTSSRDLPWIGKRGRRARHDASYTPDEVQGRDDHGRGFNPFPLMTAAELAKFRVDQAPDMTPTLDDKERWISRIFLRRYVTWCARSGRFASADGAKRLYQRLV